MDHEEQYKYIRWCIGQNIKELLNKGELSQSALARMLSSDRGNINELIAGKANPSLNLLIKIADGLGVPLTELFCGLDGAAPCDLKIDYDKGDARP